MAFVIMLNYNMASLNFISIELKCLKKQGHLQPSAKKAGYQVQNIRKCYLHGSTFQESLGWL